ncbi:hypothetical protein C1645_767364 [Glomus cerebriforme]|uniref:GAR domain-containing protein n=1 Tax=Glomus cerebriforme TaxID=658196 RepID=A0A397T8W8_9GLOM|nr:hypothetical protein C1645_767364 [Glomus cerebriforme]
MSHMPEPLSIRQNFIPSAERLGSTTDMQSFAHHVQTLYQLEVPNENIYLALSTDLPVSNLIDTFHAAAKKIDLWLEYANVAIFALELDVKEGLSVKNVSEMDVLIHKFAPNVDLLQELSQTVLDNLKQPTDEERRKDIKDTLDRIHTDWVDVKTFFGRVKKEMSESKQRRELMETMDQILASIEELNTNIFEYQEQRHSGLTDGEFSFPKLSSSPTSRSISMTPAASSSFNSNSHNELSSNADVALMKLDSRLEPLSARIEYLRSRLSAPNAPSDPNGVLAKKNNILTSKWEALKHEMDSLREECKEDKWLGVFKQVTGNATQMMDSLERAVKQCKDFIIRATSRSDSPLKLFQNRGMSIPSRHNQRSSYSRDSQYQPQQLQQQSITITPKNFQRLYKNFDAKRKYYVPTVTKMLTMLANGINNQMTSDWDAIKKYKVMKERWDVILGGVSEVQKEMPTLEALLDASLFSSNSPPSSIPSSIASSPPMSPNMRPSREKYTPEPGSPPKGQRALSPYRRVMSPSEYDHSLSPSRNNARSPSLRSKSPSPRATSPGGGHSYLTPNGRSVSPPPLSDRHPWNSQYNHSPYNSPYNSPYGPSHNNNDHGNPYYRGRASSPQPRNGRSKSSTRSESPIRSPTTGRPMTPGDRMHPSSIPRPVTSMGLASRSTSRAGMRPFLPPSTPQPGMTSRLSMVSPPPKRQPLRSPTPSSVTSSSRPITPDADDRPMTETLSKMTIEYHPQYIPLKNDALDVEVAKVVNSSPLSVKVERAGGDKYYFGNEGGGRDRKIYLCRLMNYASSKKVMVRVGGGWKDLDMFLLDYSLMSRDM